MAPADLQPEGAASTLALLQPSAWMVCCTVGVGREETAGPRVGARAVGKKGWGRRVTPGEIAALLEVLLREISRTSQCFRHGDSRGSETGPRTGRAAHCAVCRWRRQLSPAFLETPLNLSPQCLFVDTPRPAPTTSDSHTHTCVCKHIALTEVCVCTNTHHACLPSQEHTKHTRTRMSPHRTYTHATGHALWAHTKTCTHTHAQCRVGRRFSCTDEPHVMLRRGQPCHRLALGHWKTLCPLRLPRPTHKVDSGRAGAWHRGLSCHL